jgi:G-protein signaling modulator 2
LIICLSINNIVNKFKTGEARAFYNLGNIYQSKGKHMGRLLCNRDPSEFPQEVKDVLTHAINYYRLVFYSVKLKKIDFFNFFFFIRKTLELVHNKDRAAEGRTFGNLGNTYYLLGEFELAIECHSEVGV